MANSLTIEKLMEGPKIVSYRIVGIMDTSNFSGSTIVNPATLSSIEPAMPGGRIPNQVAVDRIQYSIEDGINVELIWDATSPVVCEFLSGRGKMDFKGVGGLQNDAGAGKTGKLLLSTVGYTSGTVGFTLVLVVRKQVV